MNTDLEEGSRFPNLGKLSMGILEHFIETYLGEKAIVELKAPVVQKELKDALQEALEETEKRFTTDYGNAEIREAVLCLPFADLPSIKHALHSFYKRPTDSTLSQFLRKQLKADIRELPAAQIDSAVFCYIRILREELIPVSSDIREKLSALAILGTEFNTAKTVKLIEEMITIFTKENLELPKGFATNQAINSMATNQGAQAGNISVNVNLPYQEVKEAKHDNLSTMKHDDSLPTDVGWDARDPKLLRNYFNRGRKYDPDLFKDLVDLDDNKVRDHLVSSGLASITSDSRVCLTCAGVLLLCKRNRLPRDVFHVHVKFSDKSGEEDLAEELFGSVLYLYDELYRRLKSIIQKKLGSPDARDNVGGEVIFSEYPEKAIIEALANFLIHRDYFQDDISFLTIYSDRIEFINPGQSEFPPIELLTSASPLRPKYSRNQRLIEAMNKIRINQREGSGILRIRQELEKNGSYHSDGSLGLLIENDPKKNRFVLTIFKRISRIKTIENIAALKLGNMPPLPSLFIGREDALDELKARLTFAIGNQKSTNVQLLTAVKGWPGIGKTALAAALAHDRDITTSFPDGVLWVSLGPNPNLLSELLTWGQALGADNLLLSRTAEEISAGLTALLRDKRMLLIIDDVWEPEHAIPFVIGGRQCAMLITTRINSVAQALAPTPNDIYKLHVLTDQKGLELLKALAPAVVAKFPQQTLDLIHELEGLPLAIQVAGHLLNAESSYGFDVSNLLEELKDGTRLLEAEAPADRIDLASETTTTISVLMQKSTDRLDPTTRDCFAALGVFAPKPATFDLEAMKAVWQVGDPKPIARILVDRGLLEFIPEMSRYQMHALLVMHAQALLTND